jgi:SAM-dependent methyltransferase
MNKARPAKSHPRSAADHLRQWLHESLRGLPPESAILAVGCEEAFLTMHLTEYAANVTVLDTSGVQMGLLARRFPEIAFRQHDPGEPLPFAAETFDAIWCSEFLDRVLDPAVALREMHRVLAPSGRLLVTVPDHGGVRNVLNALFPWRDESAATNPRVHHFTKTVLARLARTAGFAEVRTATSAAVRHAAAKGTRSLMLRAKKGPGALLIPAKARARAIPAELAVEDLAFASRVRAA